MQILDLERQLISDLLSASPILSRGDASNQAAPVYAQLKQLNAHMPQAWSQVQQQFTQTEQKVNQLLQRLNLSPEAYSYTVHQSIQQEMRDSFEQIRSKLNAFESWLEPGGFAIQANLPRVWYMVDINPIPQGLKDKLEKEALAVKYSRFDPRRDILPLEQYIPQINDCRVN